MLPGRSRMRVHLHPQRRTVEVAGRRSVGRLLAELGVLPNTAMVIRRDELLTDGEMVEDADEIEIRAVISGGIDDVATAARARAGREATRERRRRPLEGGRVATAGEHGWVRGANPRLREHGRLSGRAHGGNERVPEREPAST